MLDVAIADAEYGEFRQKHGKESPPQCTDRKRASAVQNISNLSSYYAPPISFFAFVEWVAIFHLIRSDATFGWEARGVR